MPTYDLGLEHVSLAFATKTIFTDVTQGVFEGDRIGIVGRNGDGKSTLLHLFKGSSGAGFRASHQARRTDVRHARPARPAGRRRHRARAPRWKAARITSGPPTTSRARLSRRCWAASTSTPRVGSLSGGQRRRADLARLLLKRLGHPRARRAHQPSGRRDDPLACRTPQEPLVEKGRGRCCSSPTTAGSSTRCASRCGRSTTA